MTQTYEAWRITYQSSEQAARAAFERMMQLEQGKCLHQIAEPVPIDAARAEFEAFSKFSKCEWSLDWDKAGFYSDVKVDAAFIWFMHGYMRSPRAAEPQAVQTAVPVSGQSRFKGEKDWQWCSAEHVAMVLATPSEWQGYEVRYVYAHPAEGVPAQAFKTKVFQALGIGSACDEHVVFVNIENLCRRADCLSAIEREFFMVETPPDESEGDTEPGEECLLNWGHTPEEYVKQFAAALAATQPAAQGLDAKAMSEWLFARRSHLGSSRESAHWGEKCWDNYTMLSKYFAAQAKQEGA